jgi:hypothetical protein
MIFIDALISFTAFYLLLSHLSGTTMRRLVGYKGSVDVVLHGTVICMFIGTSTDGLMQAEAAAILFSIYLRGYAHFAGYERLTRKGWQRYAGRLTRATS